MELIFKTEKISPRVTRIFAFNTELMYLVEGTERAALIDTGSGFGSLKACVDGLTDKPVAVLLSHGHTDHALGAAEFAEVYISPLDAAVYAVHSAMEFRARSGEMWPDFHALSPEEIIPALPFEAMKPLGAGDTFDLGGLHIETFACPGHTPGSLAFLLAEERMLFLGDAANGRTFLFDEFAAPIPAYRETLRALDAQAAGRYDRILLSHAGGEAAVGLLPSLIAVCDDILTGRADNQSFEFLGDTAYLAKAIGADGERLDGGAGNIVYRRA